MTGVREKILARVRSARLSKQGAVPAESESDFRDLGREETQYSDEELRELFAQRWQALGGIWHQAADPLNLKEILKNILEKNGEGGVTVAPSALNLVPELDEFLRSQSVKTSAPGRPETAESSVGVTGAFLAVAYSGSLVVLDHEPGELTASLLPPVHLALLRGKSLVFSLSQAVERLGLEPRPGRAVFISGPSRTADIELTLVLGVHGPREVHAVFLDYDPRP